MTLVRLVLTVFISGCLIRVPKQDRYLSKKSTFVFDRLEIDVTFSQ